MTPCLFYFTLCVICSLICTSSPISQTICGVDLTSALDTQSAFTLLAPFMKITWYLEPDINAVYHCNRAEVYFGNLTLGVDKQRVGRTCKFYLKRWRLSASGELDCLIRAQVLGDAALNDIQFVNNEDVFRRCSKQSSVRIIFR